MTTQNPSDNVRVTKHKGGAWQVEVKDNGQWETHSVWGGSKHHAEAKAQEMRDNRRKWSH